MNLQRLKQFALVEHGKLDRQLKDALEEFLIRTNHSEIGSPTIFSALS
jgi:hypothetical protein